MRRDPITKVKKINYINTNEPMQIDLIRQVIAETGSRLQRVLLLYDSQRLELAKKLIFLLKRPISVINLIYLFSDGTCLLLVRLPYSMLPSSIICIQYVFNTIREELYQCIQGVSSVNLHLSCVLLIVKNKHAYLPHNKTIFVSSISVKRTFQSYVHRLTFV